MWIFYLFFLQAKLVDSKQKCLTFKNIYMPKDHI